MKLHSRLVYSSSFYLEALYGLAGFRGPTGFSRDSTANRNFTEMKLKPPLCYPVSVLLFFSSSFFYSLKPFSDVYSSSLDSSRYITGLHFLL